jgi:hypothetical protein
VCDRPLCVAGRQAADDLPRLRQFPMTVVQATMADAFWFGSPLVCGYLRRDRCSARAILARVLDSPHTQRNFETPGERFASAHGATAAMGRGHSNVSTKSAYPHARPDTSSVGSWTREYSVDEDKAAE